MAEKMNLGEYTFEVMDVSPIGTPDMHITQKAITFTHRLLEIMGFPAYVTPMVDIKNRVFAIRTCTSRHEHAMRFSKPKGESHNCLVVHSQAMQNMLRGLMGEEWIATHRYHITGIWHAEAKAMIFPLDNAKEMPPFVRTLRKKIDVVASVQ